MAKKVYGSRSVAVSVTMASTRVLGPNPKRTHLFLSPPVAGRYSVGFGQDAVLDSGITVGTGQSAQHLDYSDLGEQIHAAVTVIGSAATTAGWLETNGECPCDEEES